MPQLSIKRCENMIAQVMGSVMTPDEYAATTGSRYSAVMRRISKGEIPAIRLGRDLFVHMSALGPEPSGALRPEPSGSREVAVADEKSRRGTRLPEGYKPPDELIEKMAAELGVDRQMLGAEHRRFCDHWAAQPGQRGVKLDWDATWRNWMRNAAGRGLGITGAASQRTNDDKVRGWMEV